MKIVLTDVVIEALKDAPSCRPGCGRGFPFVDAGGAELPLPVFARLPFHCITNGGAGTDGLL